MPQRSLVRRLISIPTVTLLAALTWILLPVAVLADLLTAPRRMPATRLTFMAWGYAIYEVIGVVRSFGLWIRFGGRVTTAAAQRRHHQLQRWWAARIVGVAERTVGLRFDGPRPTLPDGPLIVLTRHSSMGDASLPAYLIGVRADRPIRYVLKRELLADPCLDIVGNRLPNHFIDRTDTDDHQLVALHDLAADAGHDALVIFPEGTFALPEKRARAIHHLERHDPERAERARELRHTLLPRPSGTLALLEAAPDADVLVLAHTGLEGAAYARGVWRSVPLRSPVKVRPELHERATLPQDRKDLVDWLDRTWAEIDDWIEVQHGHEPPSAPEPH